MGLEAYKKYAESVEAAYRAEPLKLATFGSFQPKSKFWLTLLLILGIIFFYSAYKIGIFDSHTLVILSAALWILDNLFSPATERKSQILRVIGGILILTAVTLGPSEVVKQTVDGMSPEKNAYLIEDAFSSLQKILKE